MPRAGEGTHNAVLVRLEYDHSDDPVAVVCERCATRSSFDASLPFVNQVASFSTGHDCVRVLDLRDVTSM